MQLLCNLDAGIIWYESGYYCILCETKLSVDRTRIAPHCRLEEHVSKLNISKQQDQTNMENKVLEPESMNEKKTTSNWREINKMRERGMNLSVKCTLILSVNLMLNCV